MPRKYILLESNDDFLLNMGDAAMLQVAYSRIREFLPDHEIRIFTRARDRLKILCPEAVAVDLFCRDAWENATILSNSGFVPMKFRGLLWRIEKFLKTELPRLFLVIFALANMLTGRTRQVKPVYGYYAAIRHAKALILGGGGGLNDIFPGYALPTLATFDLASRYGKPTALFGQGIGPIHSDQMREEMRPVLQKTDLITLRENIAGPRLLTEMGVNCTIINTGDDAIELAYRSASPDAGFVAGLNIRSAEYSNISHQNAESLNRIIRRNCAALNAKTTYVPISFNTGEGDLRFRDMSDLAAMPFASESEKVPQNVILMIQSCRMMITASYHSAVFSLSSGRPAICIAASEYYSTKFDGLANQFGPGCHVLDFAHPGFESSLKRSMSELWNNADEYREGLLARAESQIRLSREAYRRFLGSL